ncbi:MAG: hypothetical protein KDE19_12740, partial [Caldilineaceae bacterium]|nr:hypothetical protein [Caldilineaceae bacterium]
MLENFPLSGFFVGYGPLLVLIIGFITFAARTDAHARRSYLRRLDPRAEDERGPLDPLPVTSPVHTETPAGSAVTLMPDEPAQPAPVASKPTPP